MICFAFVDKYRAGNIDDIKSTTGYTFSLASGVFSWNSRKQEILALFIAEEEYVAAAIEANQAIWLRKILKNLGMELQIITKIKCDIKSAIAVAENRVQYGKQSISLSSFMPDKLRKPRKLSSFIVVLRIKLLIYLLKLFPNSNWNSREQLGVISKYLKEES